MVSYDFVQASAATTWSINHGLNNVAPNIDLFITVSGTLTKVIPLSIVANDANSVTVTFSTALSGQARLTA